MTKTVTISEPVGASATDQSEASAMEIDDITMNSSDISILEMEVWKRKLEADLRAMPTVAAVVAGEFGRGRDWRGQVINIYHRGNGLVSGRIDLSGWANAKLNGAPPTELVMSSLVSMFNGALGQRGQLMNEISSDAVCLRLTGFVVDFSLWLPSVGSDLKMAEEADPVYADMVARALSRLSHAEAKEYFPMFSVVKAEDDKVTEAPMASLPLSAPAPVPRNGPGLKEELGQKDACEMMLCSTKQKKRKGMPYCGTCRKFMEETVKWYFDQQHRHPAKEKDKFVEAVRSQRYFCKQRFSNPNSDRATCACKACHSLRRFQELYPKCEQYLHKFKSRSFLFVDDKGPEAKPQTTNNIDSSAQGVAGMNDNHHKQQGMRHHHLHQQHPHSQPQHIHEQLHHHLPNQLPTSHRVDDNGLGKRRKMQQQTQAYYPSSRTNQLPHTDTFMHRGNDSLQENLAYGGYSDTLMAELFDPNLVQRMTAESPSRLVNADPWACPACTAWNHVGNTWCTRCNYLLGSS